MLIKLGVRELRLEKIGPQPKKFGNPWNTGSLSLPAEHLYNAYLAELCCPALTARTSAQLNKAFSVFLWLAPPSDRNVRSFSVVSPSIWNDLPLTLRSVSRTLSQTVLSQLKIVLFSGAGVGSTSE